MKIITQKFVSRSDLKNNPNTYYIFGDNLVGKGLGGQAKEMRGEPNALGWVTKKLPTHTKDAFMSDKDLEVFIQHQALTIRTIETLLERGRVVVFPEDGLGTGLAKLEEGAPACWRHLNQGVDYLFEKWKK
jgi:hypothetical protein